MKPSLRKNLLYCSLDGILATPWGFLSLPANFIIAELITETFGADIWVYSLLCSIPAIANALQIVITPFFTRLMIPKEMALCFSWLNLGAWIMMIIALPFMKSLPPSQAGYFFIGFFTISSFSMAMLGLGWTSWINEFVPLRIRGKYFGRRNRYNSISAIVFLMICALIFQFVKNPIWSVEIIFGIVVFARLISVVVQHGIHSQMNSILNHRPLFQNKHNTEGWWKQVWTVLHNAPFMKAVLISTWIAFWINAVAPYYPIFSYRILDLTPVHYNTFTILATISSAIFLPNWGHLIDKYGCVRMLTISLLIWQATNLVWTVLTPSTAWILYITWIFGGIVGCVYLLATFNLILKFAPDKQRIAALSVNMTVTAIASAIGPILSGQIIEYFPTQTESGLLYRILMGISPLAIILFLPIINKIPEPKTSQIHFHVGGLRNIRQILQAHGNSFLSQFTYIYHSKKRK
jgi:MFS family permease